MSNSLEQVLLADFIRELDLGKLLEIFGRRTLSQVERDLHDFTVRCRELNTHLFFITPRLNNVPEIMTVQKRDWLVHRQPDESKLTWTYLLNKRPALVFDWKGAEQFTTYLPYDPRGTHNGCREL